MEKIRLRNIGLVPDSIWSDKKEPVVYAQATQVDPGRVLIFRFYRNPRQSPKSLANRVVNFHHNINVHDDTSSFRDQAAMGSAIWSSIAAVWPRCATESDIFAPGTVIDLSSDDSEGHMWCVYRSPLFDEYLGLLRRIQRSDLVPPTRSAPTIDISQMNLLQPVDGRRRTEGGRVYRVVGKPTHFVFKGIDFATYLKLHDDENEVIRAAVETWRRSSKLVADMPPCLNIQRPPEMIVSIRDSKGNQVLMGHLSSLCKRSDLALVVEKANSGKTHVSLKDKARWCYQMSRAIEDTHRFLHTFHMNISPENFMFRLSGELVLINWEQSGASSATLAPEADGTWDVNEETTDEGTRLVYTKYTGLLRHNMAERIGPATFPTWNVFPEWQATFPRATELAEVFALGRTMWMLLTHTVGWFDDVKHPNDVRITWDGENNIPSHWIGMVERCMERDPNQRPDVEDLVKFWKNEESLLDRKP